MKLTHNELFLKNMRQTDPGLLDSYPPPGQPAPFSPFKWGKQRELVVELIRNQKATDSNHHVLEQQITTLKQDIQRELLNLLEDYVRQHRSIPIIEEPREIIREIIREIPQQIQQIPPPVIVQPIAERVVPVDLQVNEFAISAARIRLSGTFEELRQTLESVFDYAREIKEEMRNFNRFVGMNTGIYANMIINNFTVFNCVVPNPSENSEIGLFINSHDIGTPEGNTIERLLQEIVIEANDGELRQLNPGVIFIPNLSVFRKMCSVLNVALNEYEDPLQQGQRGYVNRAMILFRSGHMASINGIWRSCGWRLQMGEPDIPYLLRDLFVDC